MDILAEKIQLAKLVLETENPSVIASIKKVFMNENATDFWDELSPELQKEIDNASQEAEIGDVKDYDIFMKQYR
ncbi:hypothetical protein [Polaribacter sp.]|uniref:hypothetical protein n=1 Tax=Polaribacter sp. TaxID=1920175 RepID=UPI004048AD06